MNPKSPTRFKLGKGNAEEAKLLDNAKKNSKTIIDKRHLHEILESGRGRHGCRFGLNLLSDRRVNTLFEHDRWAFHSANHNASQAREAFEYFIFYVHRLFRLMSFWFLVILYATVCVSCSVGQSESAPYLYSLCKGPQDVAYGQLWPSLLNTLSVFSLIFYLNSMYLRYELAFTTCRENMNSSMTLLVMAIGSCGDSAVSSKVLMEFWRTLNMIHLTNYAGMVHSEIYSLETFAIPIAMSFGPYDEKDQFGMLAREDLLEIERLMQESKAHGEAADQLVNRLYNARLYRLVQNVLRDKLTTVAWPAWQAAIIKLRSSAEDLAALTTYRIPAVYTISVRMIVSLTLAADLMILGANVGSVYHDTSYESPWFVIAYCSVLVVACCGLTMLMIDATHMFEDPFGTDHFDFPVFAWVCSVAREGLELVLAEGRQHKLSSPTDYNIA